MRSILIVPVTMLVIAAIWFWHKQLDPRLLLSLQLYPVFINAIMFCVFAASLIFPPSIIERIARLNEPNLKPYAIRYTYRVTQVWCGFFVINGGIALITALYTTPTIWALYNGFISYLLMAMLFVSEYLIRIYVKRQSNT